MKISLLALLVACAVCVCGCAPALNYADASGPIFTRDIERSPDTATHILVVSFNIKFGEHVDGAIALLSKPGPVRGADILMLEEMDRPGVERIAQALALNYVYVPSAIHPASHRDFGVAVLSRWPLGDARKIPLPHPHRFRKLQRAAAAATAATPFGNIRVYAVHLETPFGATDEERRDQAEAVLADAAAHPGPAIVAGDFNGRGGVRAMADARFRWLTRHTGRTSAGVPLDHIFARELCPDGQPAAGKGPNPQGVSDHRPVWAIVRPCTP